MKKSMKFIAMTVLASSLLSGTALAKTPAKTTTPASTFSVDSKMEVAYQCMIDNKQSQKMTVMYGIKNGEPIVAQVKVNNVISTGLHRVADPLLNRFVSNGADGTMWTTLPTKADKLRQTDGGILSYQKNGTNVIIMEKCQLDKAATAKLK